MRLKKLSSRGDTIIEVLLSIAVLSMVLSVSYGLANRSSQATRQAQERGEAQKLAEEQLELLRSYITPDRPWGSNRCFPADNPSTPANESAQPTANTAQCTRGPVDPNNPSGGGRYVLRVLPSGASYSVPGGNTYTVPGGNTYTVVMHWPNVRGGTDELSLSYKLPVTGDIESTPHYECSDGIDNDGDGLIDHSSVNPTNPDPDCTSPTGDTELTPLPDPVVSVIVRKIPPGPGNTTPDCSAAATQNRSGASVRLQGGSTNQTKSATGAPPTATFPNLEENTGYTATVTAPSGYQVCPGTAQTGSQSHTTGAAGTTGQLDFKIRPVCTYGIIGYGPGYYADIARRADLDGWYVTLNGQFPTWNTQIIAGHHTGIPGTFRYVYSGSANWTNLSAYYWLYQVQWRQDPVYGYTCTP